MGSAPQTQFTNDVPWDTAEINVDSRPDGFKHAAGSFAAPIALAVGRWDGNRSMLYAIDAGSDSVIARPNYGPDSSVPTSWRKIGTLNSGNSKPIDCTVIGDRLYVLDNNSTKRVYVYEVDRGNSLESVTRWNLDAAHNTRPGHIGSFDRGDGSGTLFVTDDASPKSIEPYTTQGLHQDGNSVVLNSGNGDPEGVWQGVTPEVTISATVKGETVTRTTTNVSTLFVYDHTDKRVYAYATGTVYGPTAASNIAANSLLPDANQIYVNYPASNFVATSLSFEWPSRIRNDTNPIFDVDDGNRIRASDLRIWVLNNQKSELAIWGPETVAYGAANKANAENPHHFVYTDLDSRTAMALMAKTAGEVTVVTGAGNTEKLYLPKYTQVWCYVTAVTAGSPGDLYAFFPAQ